MQSKRFKSAAVAALVALSFATPLSISSSAFADSHHNWRRGEHSSANDRQHWREVNYREHHFRAPPRGERYVHDDRTGQYLLVGIATGAILGVLASH